MDEAEKNLEKYLCDNPCRGIVLGMDVHRNLIQLAWIMGRSENSQNRVYEIKDNVLRTEAADPSKLKDPSLIIYNVMRYSVGADIVSNGDQTDTVAEAFEEEQPHLYSFQRALDTRFCEPDAPTFTPRITGFLKAGDERAYLSILRAHPDAKKRWVETASKFKKEDFKNPEEYTAAVARETGLDPKQFPTERHYFAQNLKPGVGNCLTTYKPGSKELPSFDEGPFVVPLLGTLEESMLNIWEHLDSKWRVAIAGKIIRGDNTYRMDKFNRFEKVV
jgi:IMP cyclohydrolase